MNENDARVRYTRMVIEKTFFGLLREKNADKITVTELCTRAGINRATFYKHYEDIGMLMESEVQALIAEVEQILRECRPENAGNLTLKILLHMRENREKYVLLSLRGSQWEIPRRMFELLYASTYPILAKSSRCPVKARRGLSSTLSPVALPGCCPPG